MVTVDLKDPSKYPSRSIFDILLTIDEKPTILLELKKEGLALTDNDLHQGLSYARLIDPIPPITIISNGSQNLLYNTYTKEKIGADNIDLKLLQSIIDNSFAIAMNDFKDAVQTLLNKDYAFFSNVINSSSKEKFLKKIGNIQQFDRVIVENFHIHRDIQKEIEKAFADHNSHVGIVGSAFSGKTNLLYQIYKTIDTSKEFTFYIDCNDFNVSILQQLANDISGSSKVFFSKDKIREFFSNSLNDDTKFYLLIDNFNASIQSSIMEDILELMQMFKSTNHKVIFTVDEFNLKKLVSVKDRHYLTTIGEASIILKLQDLDYFEYEEATKLMLNNHRVFISHGGHIATEYRQPRILRQLLASYKHEQQSDRAVSIDAVPSEEVLKLICENPAYPKSLHKFYKNLSLCFLKEHYLRKKNSELATMAFLSGAVTTKSYAELFKKDLKKIMHSSFVVIRYLSDGTSVIYPKIPELVAYYAIPSILAMLVNMKKNDKSVKDIVVKFIDLISPFPCTDIIGASILLKLAEMGELELFLEVVNELLEMPPKIMKVQGEMSALTYFEDFGHIRIDVNTLSSQIQPESDDDNIDRTQIDESDIPNYVNDYLPYPVLSQLARRIFLVGGNEANYKSLHSHRFLIWKIGSHPHFIIRVDGNSIRNMVNISTHELNNGEVVCHREGVVEAIVQSIQACYINLPSHIDQIFKDALKDNNKFLLWRIYQAIGPLIESVHPEISKGALAIISELLKDKDKFPIC